MKNHLRLVLLGLIIFGLHVNAQAQTAISQSAFPAVSVTQLLGLIHANDQSGYLYAISQQGTIYRINTNSGTPTAELWLDISNRLTSGGERGLLGLAFHPDFTDNGLFYVNYTAPTPLRTIVSSFETDGSGNALADSETILLEFNQPFSNHNGGNIVFGPDGYLYIGTGDGGSGGDPQNNAQNTQNLLGAILRIDVDNTQGELNYAIPPDNPFAGSSGGRDELYAWGLRNPWRFTFDNQNATLWAGDVGQNTWESIYIIENGKNYGWRILEGSHCYNPPENCDTAGLEMPVFEYNQNNGDRSITGGYMYYGSKNPALLGKYIYGDFVSGRIWALEYDYETAQVGQNIELVNLPHNISSFAQDSEGEIYALSYGTGTILGLLASPAPPVIQHPSNGEVVENNHIISWNDGPVVDYYQLQISQSPFFEELLLDETIDSASYAVSLENGTYFARVKAFNEAGEGNFSVVVNYTVTGTTNLESNFELADRLQIRSMLPNPAFDFVRIKFRLSSSAHVQFELFNLMGEKSMGLEEIYYNSGNQEIQIQLESLKPGLYFMKVSAQGQVATRKLILMK